MPLEGDYFAISKALRAGAEVYRDSDEVGNYIVRKLKEKLNHPGRGRLYTTNFFTDKHGVVHPIGERQPHRASAPGQPPAPDTRNLHDSIEYDTKRLANGAEVRVGTELRYGAYQEYGTRKIIPRPWFRPTMLAIRNKLSEPWAKGIVARERAASRRSGGRG